MFGQRFKTLMKGAFLLWRFCADGCACREEEDRIFLPAPVPSFWPVYCPCYVAKATGNNVTAAQRAGCSPPRSPSSSLYVPTLRSSLRLGKWGLSTPGTPCAAWPAPEAPAAGQREPWAFWPQSGDRNHLPSKSLHRDPPGRAQAPGTLAGTPPQSIDLDLGCADTETHWRPQQSPSTSPP